MFEDRMFREAELLKGVAPLPALSPGLRSRVLAAAIEAQDRRAQGRRVLASALGLFAMLAGIAWMGPFSNGSFSIDQLANGPFANGQFSNGLFSTGQFSTTNVSASAASSARLNGEVVNGAAASGFAGNQAAGASASSALSTLNQGQGVTSVTGDDFSDVEAQLQSRQEHFIRFHM